MRLLLQNNRRLLHELILHQNLSASFDENLEKSAFDLLRAYGIEIL